MRWTKRWLAALAAAGLFSIPAFAEERGFSTNVESPYPIDRVQDQAGLAFQNHLEARNYERRAPLDYTPDRYFGPVEAGERASVYGAPLPYRAYPITRPGVLWSGPRGRTVYRPTYTFPYPYGAYLGEPNQSTSQFLR